ncbi:MAG: vWA domain-containing protein [Candidatus Sumerlaeia bacterium]
MSLGDDPSDEIDWSKLHFSPNPHDEANDLDRFWQIAANYQDLKKQARSNPEIPLENLKHMAIEGILRRTLRTIRHYRRKTRLVREPWSLNSGGGDIALQETLENITQRPDFQAEDVIVQVRREKPLDLVLMIDTSLSMNGRKIALCAVGAAVLAFLLRADQYSIVAFGSTARVLKPLHKSLTPAQTIEVILEAPMLGYTNIDEALRKGKTELDKGRSAQKVGVILTDGKFTVGNDPQAAAALYRRLEVMMTVDHNMDRDCCYQLARAGKGKVTEVKRYRHLPDRMLSLIRALQQ